jgi:hypothetical protein
VKDTIMLQQSPSRRPARRAVAPLEFVMALPLLFVLMICILWLGFWLIGQSEVLVEARNETWKKRFDDASGDPLFFPVLDDPVPLGLYNRDKDFAKETANKKIEISPAFDHLAGPQASHTVLAGSWDHRAMDLEKPPHFKLMATAAAVGMGGNVLDWLAQVDNPVGAIKKIGQTLAREAATAPATVLAGGTGGGSGGGGGGGAGSPGDGGIPGDGGKTTEQAKADTEAKRQEEIRLKKEEYRQLGGRIEMFGPQAGRVLAFRNDLKSTDEQISRLQEQRAQKFREMDQQADDEKKKKLQEELAQLQRKIDLTKIEYERLEAKFLDVVAELEALGINRWEQMQI